ncbi:MAG: endonuclease/exonuclease/phosphatase family protein [Deltaproteobacteria bacterium]|nr:endonuclease/exonuclease/phosphatase family protein [Deltaproteobacteria bacterium]
MSAPKHTLRVLSYNIHKGFGAGSRRFLLDAMREAIEIVHADIVLLQEVQGEHTGHLSRIPGYPSAAQFEFLADRLWPHYAYGKNAVYQQGHHGNAILSKYPLTMHENLDVSTNRFERRGVLHAALKISHSSIPGIHVLCLHLNLFGGGKKRQLERLCERVSSRVPSDAPLIVGGDFNDWSGIATPLLRERLGLREAFLDVHGKHARTFPAVFPWLKLDRIYVRGMNPLLAECLTGKPWNGLSDHAAVFAEFGF